MTPTRASGATPDLSAPIWTVEHLAWCFQVEVHTVREYTRRDDFPAARRLSLLGGRLLWPRGEVLAWFRGLPAQPASARRRGVATPAVAPAPAKTLKPHKRRTLSNASKASAQAVAA